MLEALTLSKRLVDLSREGGASCDYNSCQIFYGMLLDEALRIRSAAEKELKIRNPERPPPMR